MAFIALPTAAVAVALSVPGIGFGQVTDFAESTINNTVESTFNTIDLGAAVVDAVTPNLSADIELPGAEIELG